MSQSGKQTAAEMKCKTFKIIRLCILAVATAAAMLFMRFCGAKPAADSPLDALRDSLEISRVVYESLEGSELLSAVNQKM